MLGSLFIDSSIIVFRLLDEGLLKTEVELRTQGSQSRPKTQKNSRPRPRTALLETKDRNARGLGQGPRTQAQVLSKKKKKMFKRIFQAISKKINIKNVFKKILQAFSKRGQLKRDLPIFCKISGVFQQNLIGLKTSAVLELRTGQFSKT